MQGGVPVTVAMGVFPFPKPSEGENLKVFWLKGELGAADAADQRPQVFG